jgi:hypothetical protein
MIERVRKAVLAGIARKLWVKAGGRCEYETCNKQLWKDSLTQRDMNKAYISHIIAAKENWTRGDVKRSKILELEFNNLMLLCDECHNRIDKAQPNEHPEERLLKMKKDHEERIDLVTGIMPDKKSHIVVYTAKVGKHEVTVDFQQAAIAMLPGRFPVNDRPIELGIKNSMECDHSPEYWEFQLRQLETSFRTLVQPLLGNHPVQDFSIFAFAPQPLLIKLGTLLSDKYTSHIFQYHRQDSTWKWKDEAEEKGFKLIEPTDKTKTPALVFSLSGTIGKKEIVSVLGENCSIWEFTIERPFYDFLKTRELLSLLREKTRYVIDQIKQTHNCNPLHIFPAMPVSAAVETGKLWLSKADMPLIIYDKNTANNGFVKAIEIKNSI